MILDEELERVYTPILSPLNKVEKVLADSLLFPFQFPLPELSLSGKRLRPASFLFTSKTFRDDTIQPISLAASLELIHLSSLIHDDIIDNANFRRESKTLNTEFGNSLAVLAGDYVFSKAVELVTDVGRLDILSKIMQAVSRMIEGEMMEEFLEPERRLDEKVYMDIIKKKTAHLFRVSFLSGVLWRRGEEEELTNIGNIGISFGLAYQIIDDCADLFAEVDGDAQEKRHTLPVIEVYKKNPEEVWSLLNSDNLEPLKEKVLTEGGFSYSLMKAQEFINYGLREVGKIQDSELKESLTNFFAYLERRRKNLESDITINRAL